MLPNSFDAEIALISRSWTTNLKVGFLNMLIFLTFLGDLQHNWRKQNVLEIQFYLLGNNLNPKIWFLEVDCHLYICNKEIFRVFSVIVGFLRLSLPYFWKTGKGLLFCRNILNKTFQYSKEPTEITKKSKNKSLNFVFWSQNCKLILTPGPRRWSRPKPNCYGWRQETRQQKNRGKPNPSWA